MDLDSHWVRFPDPYEGILTYLFMDPLLCNGVRYNVITLCDLFAFFYFRPCTQWNTRYIWKTCQITSSRRRCATWPALPPTGNGSGTTTATPPPPQPLTTIGREGTKTTVSNPRPQRRRRDLTNGRRIRWTWDWQSGNDNLEDFFRIIFQKFIIFRIFLLKWRPWRATFR